MTKNKKLTKEEELNLADLVLSSFAVHGSSVTFFGKFVPALVLPLEQNKVSKSTGELVLGENYSSKKSEKKVIYLV